MQFVSPGINFFTAPANISANSRQRNWQPNQPSPGKHHGQSDRARLAKPTTGTTISSHTLKQNTDHTIRWQQACTHWPIPTAPRNHPTILTRHLLPRTGHPWGWTRQFLFGLHYWLTKTYIVLHSTKQCLAVSIFWLCSFHTTQALCRIQPHLPSSKTQPPIQASTAWCWVFNSIVCFTWLSVQAITRYGSQNVEHPAVSFPHEYFYDWWSLMLRCSNTNNLLFCITIKQTRCSPELAWGVTFQFT